MDFAGENGSSSVILRTPTGDQLVSHFDLEHSLPLYDPTLLPLDPIPLPLLFPLAADQTRPDLGQNTSHDMETAVDTSEEEDSIYKIDLFDRTSMPSHPHLADDTNEQLASFFNTPTSSSNVAAGANQMDYGMSRPDLSLASSTRRIVMIPGLHTGDRLEPIQNNDRWKDQPRYHHVRMLGHGGSASVELVLDIETNSVFARKKIRNVYARNVEDAKRKLLNEIRIMQRLAPHHHIVRVHSTRIEGRELTMILDPAADGGDLANYLQNYHDSGFHLLGDDISKENAHQNHVLRRAFGCLASALDFIHHQTVRHKDIKPQNILIHKGRVMYTDFGLSYDFGDIGRSTTTGNPQGITRRYCAPEVAEWGKRNTKSDVFSLGCVFIEIILALANDASYDKIYQGNFREVLQSFPGGLPLPSADLEKGLDWPFDEVIQTMMRSDSTLRPSAYKVSDTIFESFSRCNFCLTCDFAFRTRQNILIRATSNN